MSYTDGKDAGRKTRSLLVLCLLVLGTLFTAGAALASLPSGSSKAPSANAGQSQNAPRTAQQKPQPSERATLQAERPSPAEAQSPEITLIERSEKPHFIDLENLGVAPDAVTEQDATRKGQSKDAASAPPAVPVGPSAPEGNTVGVANASMSFEPAVISTTSGMAPFAALTVSGMQPGEPVVLTIRDYALYFNADEYGYLEFTIRSTFYEGFFTFKAQGLFSGKIAGGGLQIDNSAAFSTGLAISPHAVRPACKCPSDVLVMRASRFPVNEDIGFYRNEAEIDFPAADEYGSARVYFNVNISGETAQRAAVYTAIYTGSGGIDPSYLAGQSVEERFDATPLGPDDGASSPEGDQNSTRAFVDRAVVSNTANSNLWVIGEGFEPSEQVTVALPFSGNAVVTADSQGAVAVSISAQGAAPGIYRLTLTGNTSGDVAYAAFNVRLFAEDIPTAIAKPSRSANDGGFVELFFSKFTPGATGTVYLDNQVVTTYTVDAKGVGSVVVPEPASGIPHGYGFETGNGQFAAAPFFLFPDATISGSIYDGVTGRPIRASMWVGDLYALYMPPGGVTQGSLGFPTGFYTMSLASGEYQAVVRGSGCYDPITTTLLITPGANTRNWYLYPDTDSGPYYCADNAGRAYQPANNALLTQTFDDQSVPVQLPFPVEYYSTNYFTGTINANGMLSLGDGNYACTGGFDCWTNQGLPNPARPNNTIYALWDDLAGSGYSTSGVFTGVVGSAPNRTFIVEWREIRHRDDFSQGITNTVQLQIDEATDDIYMVYPTFRVGKSDGIGATIGLENAGGTSARVYQANIGSDFAPTGELNNFIFAGNSVLYTTDLSIVYPSPTPTATATATATACPIQFEDVPPGSTFYPYVRCLACRGIVSGYPCDSSGGPCQPQFRPGQNVTRGQISKMVALAASLTGPLGPQKFEDVPPGSTFYSYIQQLANRGNIGGYTCGGPGEPCVAPGNLPYFRPGGNTSRGQLTKIVSETAEFNDAPGPQKFTDVPPGSTFYDWVNRLANRAVIGGYTCGGPGEPCDAQNLPYFRPGAFVTRGQTAKIVASTFFPGCQTP